MPHRYSLFLVLLTLCSWSLCAGDPVGAAERPNILFIFSDDHAIEAISSYNGGRLNQTPNIDRLANEGMLFENSFCTNSICGPSRASILTGKHSHKNGFLDNERSRFDGTQMTFPKLFQKAGYQTAIVGKWHLVSDPTGFDQWEVLPGQGSYYNPDFIQMDGSRKRYPGYCTDVVTDLTLEWLKENRDPEKPFLLMCQHKSPHRNWAPPPRHLTLFDDGPLPEPETLFDDYANRSKTLAENKMSIAHHMYWGHDMKFHGETPFPKAFLDGIPNGEYRRMTPAQKARWDAAYGPKNKRLIDAMKAGEMDEKAVVRWKYQRYIKDYLRTVQAMDDGIGRILDHLDATGLAENTIVIYASDQGFYLGEHGWYDKRWMFEESFRMPFLIRWPGVVKPGSRAKELIQNIDYAPTFLDIAGIEVPAEIQGKSLVSLLKEPAAKLDRDALYYAYYGENTHNVAAHDGVRTAAHKVMYFPRTKEWQLFDVAKDPSEMRSVHADPAYADIFKAMQERYRVERERYDVISSIIPAHRRGEDWWKKRWNEKTKQTQQQEAQILFVGDSITQGWEGGGKGVWEKFYAERGAINLGFSGDRTEHALWRLRKGRFGRKLKPKVSVVMIGTNNTGHLSQKAEETAAGVQAVVQELRTRFPGGKVLLLGVFPRGQSPDDAKRKLNVAINERISKLADAEHIHFLDVSEKFVEADGTISKAVMPDYLHLSEDGYRRWAQAMEAKLCELGGFEPVAE